LKLADNRHARLAVVVGPDERARGEVVLKDLNAKSQTSEPRSALRARIAELLSQ
jgi:histidyl-tRNA synthetase